MRDACRSFGMEVAAVAHSLSLKSVKLPKAHTACVDAHDLPSNFLTEAALPERLRRSVAKAHEAAHEIQAGLTRALRRCGCFKTQDAAIAFIEKTLERLCRQRDAGRSVPTRAPKHRTIGPVRVAELALAR